jgi:hypothetical protein
MTEQQPDHHIARGIGQAFLVTEQHTRRYHQLGEIIEYVGLQYDGRLFARAMCISAAMGHGCSIRMGEPVLPAETGDPHVPQVVRSDRHIDFTLGEAGAAFRLLGQLDSDDVESQEWIEKSGHTNIILRRLPPKTEGENHFRLIKTYPIVREQKRPTDVSLKTDPGVIVSAQELPLIRDLLTRFIEPHASQQQATT